MRQLGFLFDLGTGVVEEPPAPGVPAWDTPCKNN